MFGLLIPFWWRLDKMQRLHQLHLRKVLSKHEAMGTLIPYSDSIHITFTGTTALVSAHPGRTLELLAYLTSVMRKS